MLFRSKNLFPVFRFELRIAVGPTNVENTCNLACGHAAPVPVQITLELRRREYVIGTEDKGAGGDELIAGTAGGVGVGIS